TAPSRQECCMTVFDLSGRKALVTGGARGLGLGMAQALTAAGASVMLADLLEEEGSAAAAELKSGGATAGFVRHDVTDDASWSSAVAATVDRLGGLDLVVNNAGIEITSLVVDLDADQIRRQLEVNVLGTALG